MALPPEAVKKLNPGRNLGYSLLIGARKPARSAGSTQVERALLRTLSPGYQQISFFSQLPFAQGELLAARPVQFLHTLEAWE